MSRHIRTAQYAHKGTAFQSVDTSRIHFQIRFFFRGSRRREKFRRRFTRGWKSNAWEAPLCLAAKGSVARGPLVSVKAVWPWNPPVLSSEVMKHCWCKHTVPAKQLQDGQDSALDDSSVQQSNRWLECLNWRNGLSGVKCFHYLLVCESWAHWRFVKMSSETTIVTEKIVLWAIGTVEYL